MLFFLGHLNHNPAEVPTYTCKGAKPPAEDSCSPGPRCYVEPSLTRDGKCVAPAYPMRGLPKINAEILPAPREGHFSSRLFRQDKHACVFACDSGVQKTRLTS